MLWGQTRVAMGGDYKNVDMIDVAINNIFDNDIFCVVKMKYESVVIMFPGAMQCSDASFKENDFDINDGIVIVACQIVKKE